MGKISEYFMSLNVPRSVGSVSLLPSTGTISISGPGICTVSGCFCLSGDYQFSVN